MSTRSEARYHLESPKSSHEIDFDFTVPFKDITERLNAIGGSVENLNARVGTLEEGSLNGMEERVRIISLLESEVTILILIEVAI